MTRSPVVRVRVLPAASAKNTCETVHVPDSAPLGILTAAELITEVFAEKAAVAVSITTPEGLTKAASKFVAPDRSSVS